MAFLPPNCPLAAKAPPGAVKVLYTQHTHIDLYTSIYRKAQGSPEMAFLPPNCPLAAKAPPGAVKVLYIYRERERDLDLYLCISISICMFVYMYICIYIYIYIYLSEYLYLSIYIYIYIYLQKGLVGKYGATVSPSPPPPIFKPDGIPSPKLRSQGAIYTYIHLDLYTLY